MASSSRPGLAWDDSGWDLEPRWSREPDISAIEQVCRREIHVDVNDPCTVSYHAAGAFNKLYVVRTSKEELIMRVSLPVDPAKKTRGEVATLRWVRRHTDIPVPGVIAFDASSDNEIGFEWILMELMPGESAYKRWRSMSMAQKTALVERVAELQAGLLNFQLANGTFRRIGTLNSCVKGDGEDGEYFPGQMVSLLFFWGDHFDFDVPKGPFSSSYDWADAHLRIIKLGVDAHLNLIKFGPTTVLGQAEAEEDRQDAEHAQKIAERLSGLLPRIFPSAQEHPEQTIPWHSDLSLGNILVNEQGEITAIIDWGCVSTLPLWAACETPKFLAGAAREDEPQRDRYADESEGGSDKGHDYENEDLENEGKDELYWTHLMEYEQTQLRKVYAARMRALYPAWDAEVEQSVLKQDFMRAISLCGDGICLRKIEEWADGVENGVYRRLEDVISPPQPWPYS